MRQFRIKHNYNGKEVYDYVLRSGNTFQVVSGIRNGLIVFLPDVISGL